MSLYYDAVTVLSNNQKNGSLKSRVYSKDLQLKSAPSHVYGLIKEVAKCDSFLKDIVENSEILSHERTLTPLLALLTFHDQCFDGQLQARKDHPLRLLIERHKARIRAEFCKALSRLSLDRNSSPRILKEFIQKRAGHVTTTAPKWIRNNCLKLNDPGACGHFERAFGGLKDVGTVQEVITHSDWDRYRGAIQTDKHVPDLYAYSENVDLTETLAYRNGELIIQDKASCFPAYLLLGGQEADNIGDCIDGCAAPGNKTTHMASLLSLINWKGRIFACERDTLRSKTLQMMVEKAAADKMVTILPRQDFLALDPTEERFANVTHLLLDPSCSGSGITKREDIPQLDLPHNPKAKGSDINANPSSGSGSRKRKRHGKDHKSDKAASEAYIAPNVESEAGLELLDIEDGSDQSFNKSRLQKLSNLQSMIVEYAMSFPAAKRLTYSTCSIHVEENEAVVEKVLNSEIAMSRGWRVMKRSEQVTGMQKWEHRGIPASKTTRSGSKTPSTASHTLSNIEAEACIRCWPDNEEGTMGFFVCGFVRDSHFMVANETAGDQEEAITENVDNDKQGGVGEGEDLNGAAEENGWAGFDDDNVHGEESASKPSKRKRKKPKKKQNGLQ